MRTKPGKKRGEVRKTTLRVEVETLENANVIAKQLTASLNRRITKAMAVKAMIEFYPKEKWVEMIVERESEMWGV